MKPREILTVAQMTAADQAAVANGTSGAELMERAGAAVADAVATRFAPRRAVVLAGPGNNGGDGYVAARLLRELGWEVRVEALAPPRTPDARAAAGRWSGETGTVGERVGKADLVIDALFGAGLDRPLGAPLARLARALERSGR
ncbi:MAG: NAD(P)H-hydrate epimerase, partial [Caulobacteraceae bacterium]